ncbi:biotin--[acetyl-CoA-carboxylase] ligase [Desulfothermobacter acidiphilus]|uniref:biotin--[acetyl-CoA-carboxylase] ligase n=1 Tax=Desulfothermobacter acidiphilus TaxID=1938353 RepID=UPI003F8A6ACA
MNDPRLKILLRLKAADGFVSGASLAAELGVSREAVWKQIKLLQAMGFSIKGRSRQGYRLEGWADSLEPVAVLPLLRGKWGHPYFYYPFVSSTNEVLKAKAADLPEGAVVVAEEQVGGKGRRGRSWYSPPGGIWCSLMLRPPVHPHTLLSLPLLLALAVVEALECLFPGLPLNLKWPNDLLCRGQKLGGILVEAAAETERVHWAVAGIGLNVNLASFPPELEKLATSLELCWGSKSCRPFLLVAVLERLEELYARWCREGFAPLLPRYKDRFCYLGRRVRVEGEGGVWQGKAEAVDEEGRLLLRLDDGSLRPLLGGEVTLREA